MCKINLISRKITWIENLTPEDNQVKTKMHHEEHLLHHSHKKKLARNDERLLDINFNVLGSTW